MAINTYFKNIADAIREKTGGSAFITPGQMPQAIRDISGSLSPVTPSLFDGYKGYISGNTYYISDHTYCDYYTLKPNTKYLLSLGVNVGNRFRALLTYKNLAEVNEQTTGNSLVNIDNPNAYAGVIFDTQASWYYVVVQKTNRNTPGLKSFIFEYTDIIGE